METLRANTFFLQYHGKGYTKVDIDTMSFDDFQWHVGKLKEQLELEEKHRREAELRAKSMRKRK